MAQTSFSGPVASDNGFIGDITGSAVLPTYTVATVPTATAVGQVIYVSDGLAGAPTLAVWDGSDWISAAGTAVSAT